MMSIYDERGRVRTGRVWAWSVGGAVALTAIVVGGWLLTVELSGTKGTGDLKYQRGTASNRDHWSSVFNNLYHQIQGDQQKIGTEKAAASASGATKYDLINLQGVENNCVNDVAEYNGDTQQVLAVVPDNLPQSIDSITTCGGQ